MKRVVLLLSMVVLCTGCAQMCEFGETEGSSGLRCTRVYSKISPEMSQDEVSGAIGLPQNRSFDVSYRDETYDEVWVYNTSPKTVLYFKGDILAFKEYLQ